MTGSIRETDGGDRIRLGLVGTGAVMEQHLRGFGGTGRTEIVGIVSGHTGRAEALTAQHGGVPFASLDRMLDEARPDAVVVGVPPFRNPDACRLLVERRIPFLTEKPLAATDDAAVDEIAAAVIASGLVTAVGYQLRAVDFMPELRRLLDERPPVLMVARWLGGTPPPEWWPRIAESGGQIVEQQTHHFDIARLLLGEPELLGAAVAGKTGATVPGADIPAAGSAILRFPAGALGVFASTNLVIDGGVVELQFVCEGRDIEIHWFGWPIVTFELHVQDEEGTRVTVAATDPWQTQAAAFLDGVAQGDAARPFSTYPDAARSYRLTRRIVAAAGGNA